jgi:hypothetical protein
MSAARGRAGSLAGVRAPARAGRRGLPARIKQGCPHNLHSLDDEPPQLRHRLVRRIDGLDHRTDEAVYFRWRLHQNRLSEAHGEVKRYWYFYPSLRGAQIARTSTQFMVPAARA